MVLVMSTLPLPDRWWCSMTQLDGLRAPFETTSRTLRASGNDWNPNSLAKRGLTSK
jgi:hypothetical protein